VAIIVQPFPCNLLRCVYITLCSRYVVSTRQSGNGRLVFAVASRQKEAV